MRRIADLPYSDVPRSSRRAMLRAAGVMAGVLTAGAGIVRPARARQATPAAASGTPCPATTSEEARAVALAYFDSFNTGDADALAALLAPEYAHHGAVVAQQDRDLHIERLRVNRAAFPDGSYDVQDVIADGDLVAVRHVFTATLQGPYAGVEPAGQPVAVRAVHIHRVACGQIVETWNSGDGLGLLRQVGALPPAGPSPRTPLGESGATPAATPNGSCAPMTTEETAAIARRWTEEAWDTHDPAVLEEIVSPDAVHHAGLFVDEYGVEAVVTDMLALVAAFPDVRFTADVVVAEGDRAAVRWTGRGTHDGEFQGLAPTGIAVEFTGVNVYRMACGQIVEGWSEPDSLGLLRQLGVVPAA